MFSGVFHKFSMTFPGLSRSLSDRGFPGVFQKFFRSFPKVFQGFSRCFQEFSKSFQGGFQVFSTVSFREDSDSDTLDPGDLGPDSFCALGPTMLYASLEN